MEDGWDIPTAPKRGFMDWWCEQPAQNPLAAFATLPIAMLFFFHRAAVLYLKGDERWKKIW
jgi:hypothetical protein